MIEQVLKQLEQTKEEKSYWLERVCDIEEEIDRLDADIQKLKEESN